jgi:hypothetical protein
MRPLHDYQRVTLVLDGDRTDAVVVATAGHCVWLDLVDDAAPPIDATPVSAEASFPHGSGLFLLRGDASLHETGCVVFRGHHRARVRDSREHPRLGLAAPVSIALDAAEPVRTTTLDVGRGGMLVDMPDLAPVDSVVTASVTLPDGPLSAPCRVVWTTSHGSALEFIDLPSPVGERLQNLVLTARRRALRVAHDLAA